MQKVIIVVGPTAVGKTAAAVALAKALRGEVVSADSRQVYRGLDIGTGKATKKEMRGVPHHLLDVVDPKKVFSAARYAAEARAAIAAIAARGRVPIVAGGTGFYIDALLGRVRLADAPPDEALRAELREKSLEELQKMLKKLDPERARTIDAKNRVRIVRAIEIASAGVLPESSKLKSQSSFDVLWLGITLPRPALKEKIRARLIARMKRGMLGEIQRLHAKGLSYRRMEELGLEYRYLAWYREGKLSRETMLEELERAIARYAKRQMTWFKKNKDIRWFSPGEEKRMLALARKFLKH